MESLIIPDSELLSLSDDLFSSIGSLIISIPESELLSDIVLSSKGLLIILILLIKKHFSLLLFSVFHN